MIFKNQFAVVIFLCLLVFNVQAQKYANNSSAQLITQVANWDKNSSLCTSYNEQPIYNKAAQRSALALLVLGPTKIAVGGSLIGLAIASDNTNNSSLGGAIATIIYSVIGSFHLASGIGLTAGGAILLKKAKQNSTTGAIYLRVPDARFCGSDQNIYPAGMAINTTLIF